MQSTFHGRSSAETVADFCLEMYRRMGLLDGIRVVRSSDPALRRARVRRERFLRRCAIRRRNRARARADGVLRLHEGGDSFITLPATAFTKEQISPTRDTRLRWMQSVMHCTHYVAGAGEQDYLHTG